MSYTSVPFDPDHHDYHDVSGFDCGEESLNVWLREQAGTAEVRRVARTWVWVGEDGSIAGYYALASHRVRREEVPSRVGRGVRARSRPFSRRGWLSTRESGASDSGPSSSPML